MQLAAAVDHKCLCMVPKKRNKEGSGAGGKREERKDAKNNTYKDNKHAICCKKMCVGSSLVCQWNDESLQCSISLICG